MKKIIVLPLVLRYMKPKLADHFFEFFDQLAAWYDFDVQFRGSMVGLFDADVIFLYAGYHGKRLFSQAAHLPKSTRLILYMAGPHNYSGGAYKPTIERADFIISGSKELFLNTWPETEEKFEYLPNYFAPHERYLKLSFNTIPVMKCLLTGHTGAKVYPLRARLKAMAASSNNGLVVMKHPRWSRSRTLQSFEIAPRLNKYYALALNEYFCSIATGSCYNYALAKYFEIPAAGSLMLAVPVQDSLDAGLTSWEHFVPINKKNALGQIKDCLENPDKYEAIRWSGMVNARLNHSVKNRVETMGRILNEL